jgi:2-(3-amino-3-carboxypropyl)histidine synthase
MYNLNIDKAVNEVRKAKPKLVLIQLPEGLKSSSLEIAERIERETGTRAMVSGEPCWGACDIAEQEARELGADLILHFGHSEFVKSSVKTAYIPVEYAEPITIKKEQLKKIEKFESITLLASAQYLNHIESVKKQLKGKKIKSEKPQILGCKTACIETEIAIVIGDKFHALGAALENEKLVFLLDKEGNLEDMKKAKISAISNKLYKIQEFKEAKNIGVIVSTKPGQKNIEIAEKIKSLLQEEQKNAVVISLKEITSTQLENFHGIDAFVSTACPRVSTDDSERFSKPIVHYKDLNLRL